MLFCKAGEAKPSFYIMFSKGGHSKTSFLIGFLKKTNDWSDRDMPSWDSWATNRDSWATKEIETERQH